LLVVVETGAGVTSDAETIRTAVGAALGTSIVAPHAPSTGASAGPPMDALLVTIDRQRIVVTLHAQGNGEVTRSAPAPAHPAEQLRTVAALAADVTRDRGLAAPEPAASNAGSLASGTAAVSATAAAPSPPVFAAGPEAQMPAVREADSGDLAPPLPVWTFSLVGGAASTFPSPWQSTWVGSFTSESKIVSWTPAAQVEAHRYAGDLFVGAAVDLGPGPIHPFGAALLGGRSLRAGRVCLEASAGVGVEAFVDRGYYLDGAPPGYTDTRRPRGYARVTLTASYELTPILEVLAQGSGHLTFTDLGDAGYALGALGVRLRVP
jgi:hypothetical protein